MNSSKDSCRNSSEDSCRNSSRDSCRSSSRDSCRNSSRDSCRSSSRDSCRNISRYSCMNSSRDSCMNSSRDSCRNSSRDSCRSSSKDCRRKDNSICGGRSSRWTVQMLQGTTDSATMPMLIAGALANCNFNCLRGRPRVRCLQLQQSWHTPELHVVHALLLCFPFSMPSSENVPGSC